MAVIRQRQAILHPWAYSVPTDDQSPHPGDPCAIRNCACVLRANEECYLVLERDSVTDWVCWRHIARDDGPPRPIRVEGYER